ncbi:MAG TPA: lamin tail domain-containing protein [Verrucomicrobiae bacterium]|nr:lamin tail domain-containing protein [Verrucomicrobiae bacterium]
MASGLLGRAQTVPVISNVYPNGAVQFQPSAALTFNAISSAGINPAGISVQLAGTSLPGQTFVTNLTMANGLIVSGTPTSRTVTAPLNSNTVYTATISVINSNSQSAGSSVVFDTISPAYTFEAEDFDYGGGQFINNPQTDTYHNLAGTLDIDVHGSGGANAYRSDNPGLATENAGDRPRQAYVTGLQDYDVGYNDGGSGKWGNYTRTFPSGVYNIYMRGSDGNGSSVDSASMALVTSGRGTTTQATTQLGTFSVPALGGWQVYSWVPLKDATGNLAQFTGGAVKTLRVTTDNGNNNANFYLLMPADLSVPVITNLYPDGSGFFQFTNRLSFVANATAGISANNIKVILDGMNVSNSLGISGSPMSWQVSCPLALNTNHTAVITVTANNGQFATTTVNFNAFSAANYQWEAEDYDYNGGHSFDNPQTNAYAGLPSTSEVDNHQFDVNGGPFKYRTNSLGACPSTTVAGDGQRPQFIAGTDYNIGFFGGGSWVNYTRHYPAGTYYVWGRFAEGSVNTEATLSQLAGGFGTSSQTLNSIGTFFIPASGGWANWEWAPLTDGNRNPVKVRFDGSPATLQLGGSPIGGQPEVNVNFFMLAPAAPDFLTVLQAINNGTTNVQILYSKPVEAASATNSANYVFTNGPAVLRASLGPDGVTVVLTTTPLGYGSNYSIIINGVRDRMNLPNTIATNTTVNFPALPFTLADIGNPSAISTAAIAGNGINVTAAGADFGGTNDQGDFSWQVRSGNFDVSVRVAGLGLSDILAKAGLMARETLDPASRFAASVATPAMNGAFFQWRDPAGSASSSAGNFPANYPNTWLRLQRVGNVFASYAGYDGQTWTQLGSATITMSNQVYLGFSVSSRSPSQPTTAQFRDFGNVTGALVGMQANPHEPIGSSSRTTPVAFSEIMYKPAARTDGNNTEFIEIYNSNPFFHDISGYTITCADMTYTFPPKTIMPGGAFFVVAASPSGIANAYGLTTNVFGPYSGSLKKSETLQLLDEKGAVLLTVPYSNANPWPVAADGTGHSIVLARPSYGEGDPHAWDISDVTGGSPGQMEAFRPSPLRNVVINEFLAHTDPPDYDYVELYNHSTNSVDISGCILTDNPTTNKFVIPGGTIIPARGFISFSETVMGFGLDAAGESVYFKNPDQSRILDAVQFGAQQNGVATGRWPDGANDFYRLAAKTPGAPNAPILPGDVVINELMYDPISGNDDDQYVELYNRSTNTVDMSGWQLADGIAFTIPANTLLATGGYLVIARNVAQLISHYPNLNASNCLGNFSGKLSHNGEHLALTMPVVHNLTNINVTVNDLTYGTGGRWGQWSSGGGSSLELIDPNSNNRLAANWADSDETQKSAWTNIETTGVLDNGQNYDATIDYAQIGLLDVGECLVDNIEADYNGVNYVSNPTFEGGTNGWSFQGCMVRSSLENTGYVSSHSLHIRSSDHVWTGDNSCQVSLNNTGLQPGQTVTLRFKARWLHGWPEALLRLNGNWLEAAGALPVPNNLGTPGMPNSRQVTNAGPAIYNVTHFPAVPAANQPVVVTAQAQDPNGVQNPALYYRLDPASAYAAVTMKDDGTGGDAVAGDGIFSATIPGQAAGQIVAFYISATNSIGTNTRFPSLLTDNSPVRECLVMFGDGNPGGSFAVYHLWISQANVNRWASLSDMSNEGNDGTFVSGNRVIYNMQGRFAGSPYHQNFDTPAGSPCHYKWIFNDDDKLLGATSFNKIHQPGNSAGDDPSLQREQLANSLLRALGVPWLNRHYVAVYVNGNRRGSLMEDAQTPDGDLVKENFPGDADGFLFKMQPWFEFGPFPSGNSMPFNNNRWCTLNNYTTTGGVKKTAAYRYNYLMRRTPDSASDYNAVYALVDAANSSGSTNFVANLENVADMENWMRVFAANHAAGNWDSFGAPNGQNLYGYTGTSSTKYSLLMFDFNIVFGNSDFSWGPGQNLLAINGGDQGMVNIYNNPTFLRMYWRALGELVNGPLDVANSGPLLAAKYNAFVANGLTPEDPAVNIEPWLSQARDSIATQLATVNAASFVVNPNVTVSNNAAQISGVAPVNAQSIRVNGVAYALTWTTVINWTATVPLVAGTNLLNFVGIDSHGNAIAGETASLSVTNNGSGNVPPPAAAIVFNEWMAGNTHTLQDPLDANKYDDWFELYNYGAVAVDLTGYYLTNALSGNLAGSWQIPAGYIIPPHGFLVVWADKKTPTGAGDLHTNFKLSKSGTSIALYDTNQTLVDYVTFGAQSSDISMGRYPDGGTNIVFMVVPTPRTNNIYNTAPVLGVISNIVMTLGQTLAFTASATDSDQPAQTLTFTLGGGAPAGAGITTNGQFSWTPASAPATNSISVLVSDNGTPSLSAMQTFTVTVNAPPQLIGASISGGQFTLSWSTGIGQRYLVEFKDNLNASSWTQVGSSVSGTGGVITVTNDTTASTRRFFRIRVQ